MTKETIIERIMKLKAIAEDDSVGEAEADAFAAKAAALMAEHAISEHDLNVEQSDHVDVWFEIKYLSPWRRNLMMSIADMCFCTFMTARRETVVLIGRPLNVEAARELFSFIERQVVLIARELFPSNRKAQRRAEGGLGDGVALRIKQSRLHDSETYLPVVQERDAARAAADKLFPDAVTVKNKGHKQSYEHTAGFVNSGRVQIRQEVK